MAKKKIDVMHIDPSDNARADLEQIMQQHNISYVGVSTLEELNSIIDGYDVGVYVFDLIQKKSGGSEPDYMTNHTIDAIKLKVPVPGMVAYTLSEGHAIIAEKRGAAYVNKADGLKKIMSAISHYLDK